MNEETQETLEQIAAVVPMQPGCRPQFRGLNPTIVERLAPLLKALPPSREQREILQWLKRDLATFKELA